MFQIKMISRKPFLKMTILFAAATFLLSVSMMNIVYAGAGAPGGCAGDEHLCSATITNCLGGSLTDSTCCKVYELCCSKVGNTQFDDQGRFICGTSIHAECCSFPPFLP